MQIPASVCRLFATFCLFLRCMEIWDCIENGEKLTPKTYDRVFIIHLLSALYLPLDLLGSFSPRLRSMSLSWSYTDDILAKTKWLTRLPADRLANDKSWYTTWGPEHRLISKDILKCWFWNILLMPHSGRGTLGIRFFQLLLT